MAGKRNLELITTNVRWSLKPGQKIVVPGVGTVTYIGENNGEVVYETEEGEEGTALKAYVEKREAKKRGR
jgi:preprotein translocase subunit YajC